MDLDGLRSPLERQDGVISRRQVLAAGGDEPFIRRMLRRREWAKVHRGVYVDHTGPVSERQRAWAAVLALWPAALCHVSALVPPDGSGPWQDRSVRGRVLRRPAWLSDNEVHVAIEHPRSAAPLPGVRMHRLVTLTPRVQWNLTPPRLRFEEALLDVCAEAPTRSDALALVADACQARLTSPARVRSALDERRQLRDAEWFREVLADVAIGTMSVLERGYLRRVERAHGLPGGQRQQRTRTAAGVVYRDVEYPAFGLVVELDGRLGHELARDRWRDMERDLVAAAGRRTTVRLSWWQVEERACVTAVRLAVLLQRRGWRGRPKACGSTCPIAALDRHPVGFQSPGDCDPTG